MAGIRIDNLVKRYGDVTVIPGLSLAIADGEFVVFVGPSGCGKSTLLRLIAGLETIDGGRLCIGERVVNEVAPAERNVAMVFQDYALYPHMTVRQNLAFGLENRKMAKVEIDARVAEAARMLQIEPYLERRPRALSGGQRQRVAMGRAMVREPSVFLFDEPLSNLDAKLRGDVRTEIKRLFHVLRTTMIFVTHDQVEAMTMADRIVVLSGGVVQQVGTPAEIYRRPTNRFVAEFIGTPTMNLLPATVESGEIAWCGTRVARPPALSALPDGTYDIGIRPEHWRVAAAGAPASPMILPVDVVEPMGSDTFVFGELAGRRVALRVDADSSARVGDALPIVPDWNKLHVFEQPGGRRVGA